MEIDLRTDEQAHARVVTVRGEIDLATVAELDRAVASVGPGYTVVLDLTGTDFMDSSGIRSLVLAHQSFADEGRRFRLVVVDGPISRVLEVTDLLSYLDVYPSVADALAS